MTVNEIYELVATNIVNNIPEKKWERAKLYIEADDDYAGTNGHFVSNGKECKIDVHKFNGVDWALMELHEITTEGGSNKWNRAVFSITPNGTFDMKFIWDQSLNDEIERLSK